MFSSSAAAWTLLLLLSITVACEMCLAQKDRCKPHQFYYLNKCEECSLPCDSCTGYGSSCKNCTDGYSMRYWDIRMETPECYFSCYDSYKEPKKFVDFKSQSCEVCSSSCRYGCFEAANKCNPCSSGTVYRPDTGKCHSSCPSDGGYSNSTGESRCVPCRDPNCLSCDYNGDCRECKSFWHLNKTYPYSGRCSWKCPMGCKFCTEGGVCTQCESGWGNSSYGYCTCPFSNCRECGTASCNRCQEGYVKDSTGNCTAVVAKCRQYNSSTTCEICEPGYYLFNNTCYQCGSGCRHCSSDSGCNACENGYYMTGTSSYYYCLQKPYSPKPTPPWVSLSWKICLSVGGGFIFLVLLALIIGRKTNKKKQVNVPLSDQSEASVADSVQYHQNPSAYPVLSQKGGDAYHPPQNHPQQNLYQPDYTQQGKPQGNKVYYPAFN